MRLLIVDDEKITRNVLLNYIPWSELGISRVEAAKDGKEALEIARSFHPHIVLSDIRMPKMNGLEFARCLKAEQESCRFIFLSAYSDREYLKEAIQLRAVNYVEKPIRPDEIKEAVRSAVNEIKAQHKRERQSYYAGQKPICLAVLAGEATAADKMEFPFLLPAPEGYLAGELRLYPQDASIGTEYEEIGIAQCLEESLTAALEKNAEEAAAFGEALLRGHCLFAVKDLEHIIIFLKLSKEFSSERAYRLLDQVRKELLAKLPQFRRIFVGMGKPVAETAELRRSYQQARAARRKCFLNGTICDAGRPESGKYDFSGKLAKEILNLWKHGNYQTMEKSLQTLSAEITRCLETPADSVRNYYLNLLMTLTQRAQSHNNAGFSDMSAAYLTALGESCCLEEISICMKDAARFYFNSKDSSSQLSQIADKVTQYVLDNYSDEKLSISLLAGKMYLSPNYLSLLFKKDTGKTINQFITEVRIEEAKALLKKDNALLTSIARRVGYHDANYFSKVFKRETGMTPKAYRESL